MADILWFPRNKKLAVPAPKYVAVYNIRYFNGQTATVKKNVTTEQADKFFNEPDYIPHDL